MELVFINGWGFTADFWNPLCALLPQFLQRRVDLGFYGQPSSEGSGISGEKKILIGHSLGFMHGIMQEKNWDGWIAINGFARFVREAEQPGCVSAGELRGMKTFFAFDSRRTLQGFYERIGAKKPEGSPDIERLRVGLDELRDGDVTSDLKTLNAPGLVLASHNDPLVPVATSETLSVLSSRSQISWHETGGHTLPLADPAWCAKAIQGFVESSFG